MQGRGDAEAVLTDAAALCGELVGAGSVHAWLAEHRRRLFPDDAFADLFPSGRGRPSVPADVIAAVMVLQALEGLSDREAAEALRLRIDWKVACGLALTDEGIHPTTLTYWRNRLRRSDRPRRIFDAVAEVIAATGVLKGRGRRALDSTVVDDAVATQDTVTQLVSAVRRVRRLVPPAAQVQLSTHDYDQPGKPVCAWDDAAARDALVTGLVTDALAILASVDGALLDRAQADAVGLLALVAGQDVQPGDTDGTWRIARATAADRVISTVDPDTRHVHKTVRSRRDGFKAHVAVEPETGLITDCALTSGNTYDGAAGVELLERETAPVQVLGDSAYGSAATRKHLAAAGHTVTIKPIALRRTVPGGFTIDDFTIDTAAQTVTCPAGHTAAIEPAGRAQFRRRCDGCPLRLRCTTNKSGRSISIHPDFDVLHAARRAATDPDWQRSYTRWRPMVERTIAWIVAKGHRRVRYRGIHRNQIWLDHRVAAVNLRQLIRAGLTQAQHGWGIA
ncbi:MAG TPA: IS1182 family transposase [Jiangellaceae bacterium]|nr:IS1182 family transposase [Jiangellaceae bacterium]